MSEEYTEQRRVVAIVGRPNVGKSAIFNRLAGRRIAIVHAQSGVTRDRLLREVTWEDERFELVDTGGISELGKTQSKDAIESGIRWQAEAALEDAAVVIFVTDIDTGVNPLDEHVAELLRNKGLPVFVAANKADNSERDADAADFDRLGLPVFPVSALHDRGMGSLMQAVVEKLPDVENVTITDPLKVAIVGRPNVGKSSYVNRLLRSDRVIVSDVPGTTRDSIDVPFTVGHGDQARHYTLIDTAGMRRIGKIDNSVERFGRFRAEKSIKDADVCVLVLDGEQGPTAQDKKVAAMIIENNKGCIVAVNKWDLVETTQRQYGPELQHQMPFIGFCPVVFMSAKDGYNIRKSVEAIDYVASQITATLPTGVLNRMVQQAVQRVSPPTAHGKQLRIYYATQVGTEPIRIRFYVNDPKIIKKNYRSYLERCLREHFGLEGAPIMLQFRSRK